MWLLAGPLLFAEVGETLVGFTDTVLLGRVGTAELAAIGPVDSVLDMALVPAIAVVEAMQIVVARRVGEGRREEAIAAAFRRALALVIAVSVVVAVALRLGAGAVAQWALGSGEVAHAVEDFFRFGAWGIVFLSLSLAYGSLWVGLGRTRVLVASTAVLVVLNLLLSWALIFGALGLPKLGIEGAGLAFLLAELAGLLVLVGYTAWSAPAGIRLLSGRSPQDEPPGSSRGLVRLGTPIGLQALAEAVGWVAFFVIIERLGEDALAWSSALYACFTLFLIPSEAFSETAYTMTSTSLGRGGGVGRVLRAIGWRTYAVTVPLLAVALLLPETTLSALTSDPQPPDYAAVALQVVAAGMLVVVAGELATATLFGTGDTDAGFWVEVLTSGALVAAAAVAVLVLGVDLASVWLALPVAAGLGLAAALGWLWSGRWRRAVV